MLGLLALPSKRLGASQAARCHARATSLFSTYTKDNSGTNTLFTKKPAGGFLGSTTTEGEPGTAGYKIHYKDVFGEDMSPWHQIRLQTAEYGTLNTVIEVSKGSTTSMRVATEEANNPLVMNMANGALATYHEQIRWNKGFFPETWSNPNATNGEVGSPGNNTPLDVIEIGFAQIEVGSVVPVKPLGILALIQDGKLAWKIIGVHVGDPIAAEVHDLEQLDAKHPEVVKEIREWFRSYATTDGKPVNTYGLAEKAQPRAMANSVIAQAFDGWRELRNGDFEGDCGLWTQHVKAWADGVK